MSVSGGLELRPFFQLRSEKKWDEKEKWLIFSRKLFPCDPKKDDIWTTYRAKKFCIERKLLYGRTRLYLEMGGKA